MVDVCCLMLHLDPLLCHVSFFPPQEPFCWDLSHPGFSLLSFHISSPHGVTEADEGVSSCSLQLCCAFLVTSTFFITSLSFGPLSLGVIAELCFYVFFFNHSLGGFGIEPLHVPMQHSRTTLWSHSSCRGTSWRPQEQL